MKNNVKTKIQEEFARLVIENPTLPIKFLVRKESQNSDLGHDDACVNGVELSKYALYAGEYYDIRDFEGKVYSIIQNAYTNEKDLNEAVGKIVSDTKFTKAICVYLNC